MMSQQIQQFTHSQILSGKHSFLSLAVLPHHTHFLSPHLPLNCFSLEGRSREDFSIEANTSKLSAITPHQ